MGRRRSALRNYGTSIRPILRRDSRARASPPGLDGTEHLGVYRKENIGVVPLLFQPGEREALRSLGCYPCTQPVESDARTVREIIEELRTGKFANIAERSGRAQDKEDGGGLETLRREGYM